MSILALATLCLFTASAHDHNEHIGAKFIKEEIRRAIGYKENKLVAEVNKYVSILTNLKWRYKDYVKPDENG